MILVSLQFSQTSGKKLQDPLFELFQISYFYLHAILMFFNFPPSNNYS